MKDTINISIPAGLREAADDIASKRHQTLEEYCVDALRRTWISDLANRNFAAPRSAKPDDNKLEESWFFGVLTEAMRTGVVGNRARLCGDRLLVSLSALRKLGFVCGLSKVKNVLKQHPCWIPSEDGHVARFRGSAERCWALRMDKLPEALRNAAANRAS